MECAAPRKIPLGRQKVASSKYENESWGGGETPQTTTGARARWAKKNAGRARATPGKSGHCGTGRHYDESNLCQACQLRCRGTHELAWKGKAAMSSGRHVAPMTVVPACGQAFGRRPGEGPEPSRNASCAARIVCKQLVLLLALPRLATPVEPLGK